MADLAIALWTPAVRIIAVHTPIAPEIMAAA